MLFRSLKQNENLISSNPLDDALDDFLTSCGPLEFVVKSKEVDEWIDLYIEKILNEWEIHLYNFLGLNSKRVLYFLSMSPTNWTALCSLSSPPTLSLTLVGGR